MENLIPRIYVIQRLREELLGPKGGPQEQLEEPTDPREEYTTGVLEALNISDDALQEIEVLEAAEPIQSGVEVFADDEEESDPLLLSADFAPSVDPRRLPCSIGLTFFLNADESATLEVCVSGGRYKCVQKLWSRQSRVWALPPLSMAQWDEDFENAQHGFKVAVRAKSQSSNLIRVSVYLMNLGDWDEQTKQRASRFLYQPQIRINLSAATLVGLNDPGASSFDHEEKRLQMIYRNSPVMARGHMSAAVWRKIDPEQEANSPFQWTDFAPGLEKFRTCDLRTELLPMLTVPTPVAEWRDPLGPPPELSAVALSEIAQDQIRSALSPLVTAYSRWLEEQEGEAAKLSETYRALGQEQLLLGREALARIQEGIDLLEADPEVHLAFCFANRAVHEQASWQGGRELRWRPFQLGFILLCLKGLVDPNARDRSLCDLLWFPTGGGKTEAYLALTALTLGLRRLRHTGYDGVGVLSRYTLRLLSIQQFRRALKLVTACEMLRVEKAGTLLGWRPKHSQEAKDWLWGQHRFSAGLWLGGAVTPNQFEGADYMNIPGGVNLLLESSKGDSDPAQVTECPVCGTFLSLSDQTEEESGEPVSLHLRVRGYQETPGLEQLSTKFVTVLEIHATPLSSQVTSLNIRLQPRDGGISDSVIDTWWSGKRREFGPECSELCARASRPGYYIEYVTSSRGKKHPQRIEIFCPNLECETSRSTWRERLPVSVAGEVGGFQTVPVAVALEESPTTARQCPIPALTIDEQLYAWPPSLVVSTVDKFARLAFEPRAGTLFGNVEYYHAHEGFYRQGCLRGRHKAKSGHPGTREQRVEVDRLAPPELIIQDELHLIDGPLGSMVGLYETVVDHLCGGTPKYVASTATVREASDQVQALFARELRQFPPPSLDANDSFFALMEPGKVMQAEGPGRLYMGYCAPGRGAVTPQVRVWAVMLQAAEEMRRQGVPETILDPYWTPVGYFTTIRNLATAASQWRQTIPLRLRYLGGEDAREITHAPMELSSRVSSSRLPGLLSHLSRQMPHAIDGVLSTSMFGTGVDVSRLSLMLVHGQPKTTSAYIQATGRVGRQSPGLIVTALPATNPRSLDHYEFFTGYHRQLYRGVEPVTVYPFAPRARERAVGPLCVALLRQSREVPATWRYRDAGALYMAEAFTNDEVQGLTEIFEQRARTQPELRRPDFDALTEEVQDALLEWKSIAEKHSDLIMEEYSLAKPPESPVVLGDPQHRMADLAVVFPNAPQSLREIEPTTGFKI